VDVVTAAVTPTSGRWDSVDTATPVGGMTSDDDVDGHMAKTDTCYSLLYPDVSTPDANGFNGSFDFIHFMHSYASKTFCVLSTRRRAVKSISWTTHSVTPSGLTSAVYHTRSLEQCYTRVHIFATRPDPTRKPIHKT